MRKYPTIARKWPKRSSTDTSDLISTNIIEKAAKNMRAVFSTMKILSYDGFFVMYE